MATLSAGILLYRKKPSLQVLLAHPGGPYRQNKDEGAWSLPKAEIETEEALLQTAKREFYEMVGLVPERNYIELGSIRQKGDKTTYAWAVEYQIPDDFVFSPARFEVEWPPGSGSTESFPEIDRIEYFGPFEAKKKINPPQAAFIHRLLQKLTE